MNEKKKSFIGWIIFAIIVILYICGIVTEKYENNEASKVFKNTDKTFYILSSQENKELEDILTNYAKKEGYKLNIEYQGTLEITKTLNENGSNYDAVWLSNSIWGYMLDSNVKMTNSKCTSINPVIFGIKKSKAEELGFINKKIYTKDILDAISNGKLKFSMSNPTTTNSGASAYLGLVSTLAGNPEVLTEEMLNNEELKEKVRTLFTGLERSSGSEDFLEELFLKGDYEAVVSYESSIININKKLAASGKETLYAIYPVDGVSISDSPFAYIDNKNENKKEIFENIISYLLSQEGQKLLQQKGKRTWYGGINKSVDKTTFNPDWGIDTLNYISPVKYPSTDVIKKALNMYQTELRKPVHIVFCLDYSGSMAGKGIEELTKAMDYILTEKAANDFIQFSDKDIIEIVPFSSEVKSIWRANNGTETEELLNNIKSMSPYGGTALYSSAIKALELLKDENKNKYNTSIVLMTDGQANVGSYSDLERRYYLKKYNIPIYSIMFGDAKESQLRQIANLTNAKVFNGKIDLVNAFKEVRGYN